ncbi:hypothetical protein AMC78_CH02039 [Rhizobium phaseoli]|uniref:AbiTii domain-containing protein n=1 Tax=Rhizobium TaxID=379 RepID=UPI0007EA7835|nr:MULTISPECIES: hypothetical protein [Rhizobium]ANM04132.1 hypothetical protein AMC78_CH02039 [Rhizobium phaseoli]ARQ58185.1 hypothetical protein Kim5_CH02131 [Rhizobium sp. Kim5]
MGLLADIQSDAVSDNANVATLLRKCMLLAHQLDSELLEDWVRYELKGYPENAEVPDYREMGLNFKISASNRAWQATNQPVPQLLVNQAVGNDQFHIFKCRQAVGTIDVDKIKGSDNKLTINLDNYALILHGKVYDESYSIQRFWAEVPSSGVIGIIDAVKNRVLEFTLALQKRYPSAGEVDGMKTSEPAVQQAISQIFHTTINGNAGVIGTANNSTVNVTVNKGNMQDLRNQLAQHGVEEDDLIELEAAVNAEGTIEGNKTFGPKVTKWVGKMLGKAASGAWSAGLGAGGALLERALLGYYGYS